MLNTIVIHVSSRYIMDIIFELTVDYGNIQETYLLNVLIKETSELLNVFRPIWAAKKKRLDCFCKSISFRMQVEIQSDNEAFKCNLTQMLEVDSSLRSIVCRRFMDQRVKSRQECHIIVCQPAPTSKMIPAIHNSIRNSRGNVCFNCQCRRGDI